MTKLPMLRCLFACLMTLMLVGGPALGTTALISKGPARVEFGPGKFLLGANLPWISYGNDFGANAWHPQGGIARPEQSQQLEATLSRLAARGVHHVRWFMLTDGRAGIRFAADGTPLGLDEFVFPDIDAALAVARRHNVRITFTLLDFLLFSKPEVVNGVQLFGRGEMVREPHKRQALLDNVLRPILARYGSDPAILAWDVINEPEWATYEIGADKPIYSVSREEMRKIIGSVVKYVHQYASQPVTVGSASTRYLDLVRGLGLDFYQVHWYDHFEADQPLARRVELLHLDKPIILGEFPTKGSRKDVQTILKTAYQAGYGGAMPWAVLAGNDGRSDYAAGEQAMTDFAKDHANALYL